MRLLLSLFILILTLSNTTCAQDAFDYKYTTGYKTIDTEFAVDYIFRTINPKFPKNVHTEIKNIKLFRENFKLITLYYSEYDGATRGESKFFISFWKEYADYIECLGSNILNIYDPEVTISNNIITIKGKRRYEPLSLYYYSFIYKNNNFYYNSILGIHRDADDNTTSKYYFSSDNKSVNINSIFADKLIKDE